MSLSPDSTTTPQLKTVRASSSIEAKKLIEAELREVRYLKGPTMATAPPFWYR